LHFYNEFDLKMIYKFLNLCPLSVNDTIKSDDKKEYINKNYWINQGKQ